MDSKSTNNSLRVIKKYNFNMRLKIFVFYGYFLKGTGSAIYARELVRALNRCGADVVLFSQEERPEDLDFIQESHEINLSDSSIKRIFFRTTIYSGKTIHYRHDLKGILPVYVYDSYPGYREVKTFSSMTEEDLGFYKACLQQSVKLVLKKHGLAPSGVLYHHIAPLPSMLYEVFEGLNVKQIAIYHGSDLNFALKKNRFLETEFKKIARKLDGIITLAESGKSEVQNYLGRDLPSVVEVVPPGLDFYVFYPRKNRQEAVDEFCRKVRKLNLDESLVREREILIQKLRDASSAEELSDLFKRIEKIEAMKLTEPSASRFMSSIADYPLILFAGKYLWTKGPACLLYAMPFIWKEHKDAVLILVGFGASRGMLEKIRDYLSKGMIEEASELTMRHFDLDPGSKEEVILDAPVVFSEKLRDRNYLNFYRSLSDFRKFESQVAFIGYLDHNRLAPVLSASDVFVAPSIFKESFGLVLIEAIASGTLPVGFCHSGFKDTLELFSRDMGFPRKGLCVGLDENCIENLADAINAILGKRILFQPSRNRMHEWAFEKFSWDAAAKRIVSMFGA